MRLIVHVPFDLLASMEVLFRRLDVETGITGSAYGGRMYFQVTFKCLNDAHIFLGVTRWAEIWLQFDTGHPPCVEGMKSEDLTLEKLEIQPDDERLLPKPPTGKEENHAS